MGIKDIDINKDRVTLGDHIENMKENQYIFGISASCGIPYFSGRLSDLLSTDQHDIFKYPVMNILKTNDLFTGADAAFDDRSFTLTVI